MRILVTNNTLAERAGTQLYVKDLAIALRKQGHEVAIYSNVLGGAADDARDAGIMVINDLGDCPWTPDIIHGHHHMETMTALVHFPGVPAICVAHGWQPWQEIPLKHPRVLRYIAVDRPTLETAIEKYDVPAERISVVPNFVDLGRFAQRPALPALPRHALVFSNRASEGTYVPAVREACARKGISLSVAGAASGRVLRSPESVLGQYDLVFAKGRAALEALAVGNALVVCDAFGAGPMVTTENVVQLRTLEGDYMRFYTPLSTDALVRQIERYDPADAAEVTRWIRSVAGVDQAVPHIVAAYRAAIEELARQGADPEADSRAVAAYLRWLSMQVKEKLAERRYPAAVVRLGQRLNRIPMARPVLRSMAGSLRLVVGLAEAAWTSGLIRKSAGGTEDPGRQTPATSPTGRSRLSHRASDSEGR